MCVCGVGGGRREYGKGWGGRRRERKAHAVPLPAVTMSEGGGGEGVCAWGEAGGAVGEMHSLLLGSRHSLRMGDRRVGGGRGRSSRIELG